MYSRALPLFGAVAAGFTLAMVCFTAWTPRPANAQRNQPTLSAPGLTVAGGNNTAPQPLEIQPLDRETFVVATREPRLVSRVDGAENSAQYMLVTVITHYTLRGDRLLPIENVRVPAGYREVRVGE